MPKSTPKQSPPDGRFGTGEELVRFAEAYSLSGHREIEVLAFTLEGRARKHMVRHLRIGIDAVNKACDRVHKKLGLKDRMAILRAFVAFRDELRRRGGSEHS